MQETSSHYSHHATAMAAQQQLATHVTGETIMSTSLAQQEEKPVKIMQKSGEEVIDTRFGKVTISHDKPIQFAKGMLGMSNKKRYCLTVFPVKKFARFKLLQSLDDITLSFITLPVEPDNIIIAREDILTTARDLGIAEEDLSLLLVVSVHRDLDNVRLSVNARAPIFIDVNARTAEQIVLRSNDYQVRHMISGSDVTDNVPVA